MSKEIMKYKGCSPDVECPDDALIVYLGPCCRHGLRTYIWLGSVNTHGTPLNASSPLAKKAYKRECKLWGQYVIHAQLARRDEQ